MNFPVFSEASTSLAKKHLTLSVFNTLKSKKTPNGFSLSMALASGIKNDDSGIGVYAGDAESYDVFSALISPIIEEYHGIEPGIIHGMDRSRVDLPDLDPRHKYILSTRIRVARNLAGYAFTPFIQKQQRKELTRKIIKALENLPEKLAGMYIAMDREPPRMTALETPPDASVNNIMDITPDSNSNPCQCDNKPGTEQYPYKKQTGNFSKSPEQLKKLPMNTFLFKKGDRFQDAAGINRDWPSARGCFVSHDTKFRVWINEEDHLRIISMDEHGNMSTTFNRLAMALENLEKNLNFAWDDKLGYLGACPSNIGTGMRAGVHIHLPRLFHQQKTLHKEAKKLNLQIRGTQGEKTRVEKAVFDISNEKRLGITEKECLYTLYRGVSRLIELEEELRRADGGNKSYL